MSTAELEASPEQLCYIPCSFCNIVLAVSVPCSNLLDIVTVRCGNCANFCCVNMSTAALSSTSHDSSSSLQYDQSIDSEHLLVVKHRILTTLLHIQRLILAHPQDTFPSNHLLLQSLMIKRPSIDEIQRIKANDPNITHREAFSAAAKNWAHFPHIHFGVTPEANNHQEELNETENMQLLTSITYKNQYSNP
ncbi:hypothetical protein CTI12_AA080490 [Artemisia annua]|uniref:YABBY transcription factor n=1 Tax=Artemisia annua TaxID=35608 RepID=A0A2U1P2P7_ARTAN|nr:hypothetical protein CTI12_AA080490 [Artemisia annua]QCF59287.1 YABBY transcription factor [Artemisia annua]